MMTMKLFSMASHSHPSGLEAILQIEQGYDSVSKDFHQVLPFHGSNQHMVKSHSFNLTHHQQKDEWKPSCGLFDCDQFVRIDPISKRPSLIDVQDTHPDLLLFSNEISNRLTRQEKMLKLLSSGSIEADGGLEDLSMLYDLMEPQQLIPNFPNQSLIYPTGEFYLNEPFLNLVGNANHSEGQIQYNCTGTEIHDALSVMARLYLSKNAIKSSKQMLVPYFEWRRRSRATTDALKLATEKSAFLKTHERTKEKTSQKKKTGPRTGHGRDIYSKSYLRAFEILLSIIVDRKQQGKNVIPSLKKSGTQLPQLLVQFSASIAGTGIVLVLSVLYRVTFSRGVSFCASKLLSTGLGLGLVWLSWAVNKLRDTVISISKNPGNFGEKEDEMMNDLDRDLKDIYFRAAALMAVAVLRLG